MVQTSSFANLLGWVEQLGDCISVHASPSEMQEGLSLIWSIHTQIHQLNIQLQQQHQEQLFEEEFSLIEHALEKVHDDLNSLAVLPRITIEVYIEYIYLQLKELLVLLDKGESV
jgi:hypothetical protein